MRPSPGFRCDVGGRSRWRIRERGDSDGGRLWPQPPLSESPWLCRVPLNQSLRRVPLHSPAAHPLPCPRRPGVTGAPHCHQPQVLAPPPASQSPPTASLKSPFVKLSSTSQFERAPISCQDSTQTPPSSVSSCHLLPNWLVTSDSLDTAQLRAMPGAGNSGVRAAGKVEMSQGVAPSRQAHSLLGRAVAPTQLMPRGRNGPEVPGAE